MSTEYRVGGLLPNPSDKERLQLAFKRLRQQPYGLPVAISIFVFIVWALVIGNVPALTLPASAIALVIVGLQILKVLKARRNHTPKVLGVANYPTNPSAVVAEAVVEQTRPLPRVVEAGLPTQAGAAVIEETVTETVKQLPSDPHERASFLTLGSGMLEKSEVVLYDRRPHWWMAVAQLTRISSLIAWLALTICLLTPWPDGIMTLVKIGVVVITVYWLGYQMAAWLWRRYVVTNRFGRIIYRPWRIFGGENSWSIQRKTLNTIDHERRMWMRLLFLNCTIGILDGPGDRDKMFNRMPFVSNYREFMNAVSTDGKVQEPTRTERITRRWRQRS